MVAATEASCSLVIIVCLAEIIQQILEQYGVPLPCARPRPAHWIQAIFLACFLSEGLMISPDRRSSGIHESLKLGVGDDVVIDLSYPSKSPAGGASLIPVATTMLLTSRFRFLFDCQSVMAFLPSFSQAFTHRAMGHSRHWLQSTAQPPMQAPASAHLTETATGVDL